jgi:hypothetical protein
MLVFLCFIIYITNVLAIWVLIPRDNSTIVDAANVLGCIRSTNVIGNNTKIYIDNNQQLVLEIEYLIDDYRSSSIVWKCLHMFGPSITLSIDTAVGKFGPMPVYIGTLSEVTDKWFAIIPRLARQQKIEHPFGDQKDKEKEKEEKQRFCSDYCTKNKKCPYDFSYGIFNPRIKQSSIFQGIRHNGRGKSYI